MMVFIVLIFILILALLIYKKNNEGGAGEDDELFQTDTVFLLKTGIQILERETDGGFIQQFGDEIGINLSDTYLLGDMKQLRFPMEKMLEMRYSLDKNVAEKFVRMTELYVENDDGHTAWISFVYHYSGRVPKKKCREWTRKYLQEKYPKLQIKEKPQSLLVII